MYDVVYGYVFGDVFFDDVCDVIFKLLSVRDVVVLVCMCKEFRAFVASW